MKKYLILLFIIFCSYSSFASHGMGGEITWTCDGTGNYIFQMKFYRDCNGIPGPGSVSLSTNVPGVPNIPCTLISQTDISPDGGAGTGNSPCVNCPPAGSGGNGAVEEYVFLSAPTVLPGVPPATGWAFWWGDCCRSAALTNIGGAGSIGFALRAKMYPFPGQAPGLCSDNSPYFAERPSVIICTGYPFTYNHLAIDPEMDSLNYEWASPIDNIPYPWTPFIPFAPGYSVTNQVPGNPTLDQHSGQIAFNSSTGGYFATVLQVSSYKCGILVSVIYREINIVLITGCVIPIAGNPLNYPPAVTLVDSNLVLFPSNDTTVHAGDIVKFRLVAADFDIHPPASSQIVTFNASGQQFGAGFTSITTGCLIPPCAILSPPPPVSSPASMQINFNWTTTTDHLGLNYNCVYLGNKYYFVIRTNDNYCSANAISNTTVSITVLPNTPAPLVSWGGGQLSCLTTGNYSYQWFLNRFAIAGATGQSYTPLVNGYYQVLAVHNVTGDGNYSDGIMITVGMEDISSHISGLTVYPNPSHNGKFQLSFSSDKEENVVISIKDALGKSLIEKALADFTGKYSEEINLSAFSKGIYTVELKTGDGRINKKLILL
ncbi:MAG TPA: T9SS type A sorting domain-containing protein [Bacteroidia bacterium]|nr:T9SS type A sorting domain-containing protein [Bacteroidia bacterium]